METIIVNEDEPPDDPSIGNFNVPNLINSNISTLINHDEVDQPRTPSGTETVSSSTVVDSVTSSRHHRVVWKRDGIRGWVICIAISYVYFVAYGIWGCNTMYLPPLVALWRSRSHTMTTLLPHTVKPSFPPSSTTKDFNINATDNGISSVVAHRWAIFNRVMHLYAVHPIARFQNIKFHAKILHFEFKPEPDVDVEGPDLNFANSRVSLVLSIGTCMQLVSALPVSIFCQRFGLLLNYLVGVLMMLLGSIPPALDPISFPLFAACFGIILPLGICMTTFSGSIIIEQYFCTYFGLANAVTSGGAAIAYVVIPIGWQWLLDFSSERTHSDVNHDPDAAALGISLLNWSLAAISFSLLLLVPFMSSPFNRAARKHYLADLLSTLSTRESSTIVNSISPLPNGPNILQSDLSAGSSINFESVARTNAHDYAICSESQSLVQSSSPKPIPIPSNMPGASALNDSNNARKSKSEPFCLSLLYAMIDLPVPGYHYGIIEEPELKPKPCHNERIPRSDSSSSTGSSNSSNSELSQPSFESSSCALLCDWRILYQRNFFIFSSLVIFYNFGCGLIDNHAVMQAESLFPSQANLGFLTITAYGIVAFISKFLFGALSDAFPTLHGRIQLYAISCASLGFSAAITIPLLWFFPYMEVPIIMNGLYGLSEGSVAIYLPALVSMVGSVNYPRALAINSFFQGLSSIPGPIVGGLAFDLMQSYDLAFEIAAAVILASSIPYFCLDWRRDFSPRTESESESERVSSNSSNDSITDPIAPSVPVHSSGSFHHLHSNSDFKSNPTGSLGTNLIQSAQVSGELSVPIPSLLSPNISPVMAKTSRAKSKKPRSQWHSGGKRGDYRLLNSDPESD